MKNVATRGDGEVVDHVLHADGALREFIAFGFEDSCLTRHLKNSDQNFLNKSLTKPILA